MDWMYYQGRLETSQRNA